MSATLTPFEVIPPRRNTGTGVAPSAFEAAFANFLRLDVANGDASADTVSSYRNEVAMWVAWCVKQGLDAATATVMHIKRYRSALLEAGYKPITRSEERRVGKECRSRWSPYH